MRTITGAIADIRGADVGVVRAGCATALEIRLADSIMAAIRLVAGRGRVGTTGSGIALLGMHAGGALCITDVVGAGVTIIRAGPIGHASAAASSVRAQERARGAFRTPLTIGIADLDPAVLSAPGRRRDTNTATRGVNASVRAGRRGAPLTISAAYLDASVGYALFRGGNTNTGASAVGAGVRTGRAFWTPLAVQIADLDTLGAALPGGGNANATASTAWLQAHKRACGLIEPSACSRAHLRDP